MSSDLEISFEYTSADFIYQTNPWVDASGSQLSRFDKALYERWDNAMKEGAFRYAVDHTITRLIPGPKKYLCHLNQKRGTDRRKPQEITSLKQAVKPDAFNFTKVKGNEIIFHLKNKTPASTIKALSNGDASVCSNGVNGHLHGSQESRHCHSSQEEGETHTLLINNSPLDHGHSLLTPDRNLNLPQVLTLRAATAGIETLLLSQHRGLCLGYNSLCAFASVNHLHIHLFYIEHEIIGHYAPARHIAGKFFEFTALPTPAIAMQLHGSSIDEMARMIHGVTSYLHEREIAHNLFLCRGCVFGEEPNSTLTTIRAYIWPRNKYIGDPTKESFNLACIELPGYLAFKDPEAYHNYTEADVDQYFINGCVPPAEYEEIISYVTKMGQKQSMKD